jgi:hypothetical protein
VHLRTNRLLALALSLPPNYFLDKFDKAALTLRPIHYTAEGSDPNKGLFAAGGGALAHMLQQCSGASWRVYRRQGWAFTTQLCVQHAC